MANSKISEYLKLILSAVYGKEVRQAIHDAISQCYEDVNSPSLNAEAIETAVQAKIDDGTIAAMTIQDGSVTQEKLSPDIHFGVEDGEVTFEKLGFGTYLKSSRRFFITATSDSGYGAGGILIEAKLNEKLYCNFSLSGSGITAPTMISVLPDEDYGNIASIGTLTVDADGGYVVTSEECVGVLFPITFAKKSNWDVYLSDGLYDAYVVQNQPLDAFDSWYAANFSENFEMDSANLSPLFISSLLKGICPLIGAKVAVLGDSLAEQSAGYLNGADAYGFYTGTYTGYGWFSRIARKYKMSYKVHGYGQQWWYCTDAKPNGGVKAVNNLVESGFEPDYVVLEYGTNDIWTGAFGESTDVANETATSTVGALRYCIETLQEAFPSSKLIVIMPCMHNGRMATQDEYYNLICPILREYSVRYVDMFGDSGITKAMMHTDFVHLHRLNPDGISYTNNCDSVEKYSRCLETAMLML